MGVVILCVEELAMAKREAFVVILLSFSLHLFFTLDLPSYLIHSQYATSHVIIVNVCIGISLLLFPLFGALADIYLTRHRMIQASLFVLTAVIVVSLAGAMLISLLRLNVSRHSLNEVGLCVAIIFAVACIGIFDANAIQFGTDQLLEAPSAQLSAFVHWYFWCAHIGQHLVFCSIVIFANTFVAFSSENTDFSAIH